MHQGEKAAVEFAPDGRAVLRALKNPDVSSALHEFGHIVRCDLISSAKDVVEYFLTWRKIMPLPSYFDPEKPPKGVGLDTWKAMITYLRSLEPEPQPIPPCPEDVDLETWQRWNANEREIERTRDLWDAPGGIDEDDWERALVYLDEIDYEWPDYNPPEVPAEWLEPQLGLSATRAAIDAYGAIIAEGAAQTGRTDIQTQAPISGHYLRSKYGELSESLRPHSEEPDS